MAPYRLCNSEKLYGAIRPLKGYEMEYIYPCKNEGKCRQLMFEGMGLSWSDTYPKFGKINVTTDSPMGIPVYRGNYKCCTQCHLPLDRAESETANKLYGITAKDIPEPDAEFMRILSGF